MKIMNTQKTIKNSIISMICHIVILILSFVNRRIFVIFLDIEYLGYQSLFSNIFSIISVAELGIGHIISFHLYIEIAKDNKEEIGKLMNIYKCLYYIVSVTMLILGVCCCFFLSSFIKETSTDWLYLYIIYFLQLLSVVAGYAMSYKRTFLIVTQQEYRCIQIEMFVTIVVQLLQVVMLAIFRNYILYLCMQLSIALISNFIISIKVDKEYPYLKNKYVIKKEDMVKRNMFSDIKSYLIHQISYAIYSGTDNIMISAFCGIRDVALYGNYLILQKGFVQLFSYRMLNPVQAALGNIIYGDTSKEKQWEQFNMLDVFSFFLASYVGNGFLVFLQPAIQLWMGKDYLLSDKFVWIFSVTIYFVVVWEIIYKYRNVFGDYIKDRNLMILSAVLNILISIPGGYLWGIEGVQFGTLIAFFPIVYGRIRFVVKGYFKQSVQRYIMKHIALFFAVLAEGIICWYATRDLSISVSGILQRFGIWVIIPMVINVIIFFRNIYFKAMLKYLSSVNGNYKYFKSR